MGENAIYCWQIMMETADKSFPLCSDMIGVVSNKCNNYGTFPWNSLVDSYGISGSPPNVYLGTSSKALNDQKYKSQLQSGQIVTVELNCVSSIITFKLKDKIIYSINLPKRKSWFPTV
eukprot:165414_1